MTMIPIDDQSMMDVAYHDTGERLEPEVVIIPASIEKTEKITERKNLRVAAYCRVSTDSEEQMTSYETQLEFYTKMINENPKLYAMFAQAESESISNNEKDGRRKGYQIGKVPMMYGNVLGYRKGADGQAEIDKEEASIIIYVL